MVVPSFTGFAQTPHVAASFLGGVASAQRDREEANRVAIAGQHIQLQQQKLQQEAVQSQMEFQAKQQVLEQQSMRANQELNIKSQYDQQMLGMKQQQVDQAAKLVAFKTQEAARRFQAQQQFKAEAQQGIEGGAEPESAYRSAAMKFGPEMGMTGAGMASLMRPGQDAGPQIPGSMQEAAGGGKVFWNTGKHAQYIAPPSQLGRERLEMQQENAQKKVIAEQIKSLEKVDEKDLLANFAEAKEARDADLKQRDRDALAGRKARRAQITDLRKSLTGGNKDQGPKRVSSQEEYDDLDAGEVYIDPKGKRRRKGDK